MAPILPWGGAHPPVDASTGRSVVRRGVLLKGCKASTARLQLRGLLMVPADALNKRHPGGIFQGTSSRGHPQRTSARGHPPGDILRGHPPEDILQGTSASGHPPGDILHGTSRGRPPGFILQGAPSRGHPPGDILQRTSPSGHPADGSRGCPLGGRAPENEASSGDWERSGRAPGKGRTSGEL